MKSSFLAVFFLGAAIAACSGTGTRPDSGGAGGEEVTTSTGSTSSSSGMGGAGGNGGDGGAGGSAPMVKADNLGQICNAAMPCPTDYLCVFLPSSMTNGYCTMSCPKAGDMAVCGTGNGFPGPGLGVCGVQVQNQPGFFCGVLCGTQIGLPEMCPTGLTCIDAIDAAAMKPGMDGKTDTCAP